MKHYIAADGGGTKLDVILFDEELNVLKRVSCGGINEKFKSADKIEEELISLADRLFCDYDITEIERAGISLAGKNDLLIKCLDKKVKVKEVVRYNEGETVLLASGLKYGVVAQAGTGSDVFCLQPNGCKIYGGFGSLLGDEGSGFYIGREGLKSAVYDYYGYGEKTSLKKEVFDFLKITDAEQVRKGLATDPLVREKTASIAKIVSKEAEKGDIVARGILTNAGKELGLLTNYAVSVEKGKIEGAVIASGGAWKGYRGMFDEFYKTVAEKFPSLNVKLAEFEPIAGILFATGTENGMTYESVKEKIYEKNGDLSFSAKGR